MSYYVGYSQREIYKKRCDELGCACNSAVVRVLSDAPDDVASLTSLDLSRNFLGSKGVIPLLDVIEGATQLRSLDLRDQKLGNDAVEVICARLRRHPSLLKLNLSSNPITLAVSSALLELARQNTVIQYIYLEHTLVRPAMVTVIEVQLEKNRAAAAEASSPPAAAAAAAAAAAPEPEAATPVSQKSRRASVTAATPGASPTVRLGCEASTTPAVTPPSTPAGGGAAAAATLARRTGEDGTAGLRQRSPAHELQHVCSGYSHTVADVLFDANPTEDVWNWCESRRYVFDDDQFNSHNDHLHRTARHTYGIAGWRRIGELYPDATLFGWDEAAAATTTTTTTRRSSQQQPTAAWHTLRDMGDGTTAAARSCSGSSGAAPSHAAGMHHQLPKDVPQGFTWTFTALMASVTEMDSLHAILCAAPTGLQDGGTRVQRGIESPGVYAMRLFVEGQWRFLLVDDFLPVDRYGELIFTKPSLEGRAYWPCILEKMLAKLHGGYHALDSHFDKHHVGIDGPHIRKPIAWQFLTKENLQRVTGGGVGAAGAAAAASGPGHGDDDVDGDWGTVPDDSLICEEVARSCGRIMSRLTSGLYDSYQLHPIEEAPTTKVFEVLHRSLGVPLRGVGGGANWGPRRTASVRRSFLGGHSVSVDAAAGGLGSGGGGGGGGGGGCLPAVSSYLTAAVAFSRDASHTFGGIHPRCGYQVVRVCHAGGVRLLELRNPWCGTERWRGDWADDSPLWKKHPEVADMLLTRGRSGAHAQSGGSYLLQRSDMALALARSSFKRSLLSALSETGGSLKEATLTTPPGSVLGLAGPGAADAGPRLQKSTFWIAYTDFLQNFEWVHTCRVFGDEFYRQDVHGTWTRDSAGGNAREPSWHSNPHYRLSFPYRTTLHVQLTRRDHRLRRTRGGVREHEGGVGGIGLQLLRDSHYPLHCPASGGVTEASSRAAAVTSSPPFSSLEDAVAASAGYDEDGHTPSSMGIGASGSNSTAFTTVLFSEVRHIGDRLSLELVLDAGAQYWMVPTTYAPRVLDDFDVAVLATSPFQLQEARELQYWDQRTAPTEVLFSTSSNTQQVGQNEGEVAIIFDSRSRIASDADLLLQCAKQRRQKRVAHDSVEHSIESASATLPNAPCRVVVAATVDVVAPEEDITSFGVDEAYDQRPLLEDEVDATPTLQLVLVPGEVDAENRPTRTVGEIHPHPAHTYVLERHTVMETSITPVPLHIAEYHTLICSLRPTGARAQVHYRVWCAAPLLEVRGVPMWSKQEVTLSWEDEKGSGNYYEGTGHPQVELSKLRPYQRFAVSLRMVDYDTIEPAIMFSVVRNGGQKGEPIEGRLSHSDVWSQSAYVDGTYVQSGFDLDEHPPESLLLIPCLQPTGSKGRCVLTISSDFADYRAHPLRTSASYPL
ncbi:calpain-like cysteine peptidase [Novymonas esmeraldas]|uniref:Calpain-like cysteine peptidase n=1 Tax=Novymonas esmeraldas TaxID=1808958 RepID=A0AAW0F6S0_9TRYP